MNVRPKKGLVKLALMGASGGLSPLIHILYDINRKVLKGVGSTTLQKGAYRKSFALAHTGFLPLQLFNFFRVSGTRPCFSVIFPRETTFETSCHDTCPKLASVFKENN